MVQWLAGITLLLSAMDHWTTWVCLRQPVEGWHVAEANPISDWLFGAMGLVPGLAFDSVLTLGALFFLVTTRLLPTAFKSACLGVISVWTGYAVANNLGAIAALGLSPLGAGS